MSANMCVESHARDAIENGFDVIIVADATAAAGDAAYEAAITNFEIRLGLAAWNATARHACLRVEYSRKQRLLRMVRCQRFQF
jgi:nicotinamidase-related amidase